MIINNCRLIPELSGGIAAECGSIVIENEKILKVSETPFAGVEAGGEVFDCEGRTLLPGLIDLHTHITMLGGAGMDCLDEPMKLVGSAIAQAQKCLSYGFTTVRDCGSIENAAIYARDIINKGIAPGPMVLANGETLIPSIVWKPGDKPSNMKLTDGAEEYRRNEWTLCGSSLSCRQRH